MNWTEPADQNDTHAELESRLWSSANQLWANAALKPSEYSPVVLGLIFLRFADVRFAAVAAEPKPAEGFRRRSIADDKGGEIELNKSAFVCAA